jgi:anti-anti-sigma factor
MTRQHGLLGTAANLVPFAHVGWGYRDHAEFCGRAAEYIADGRQRHQWVEYVGRGTPAALRAELATPPNMRETSESAEVAIRPLKDFYAVRPGTEVVDPEASLAKLVAATEEALAAGYTGSRAVVDVTALVRTPEQREAFARYEWGLDQKLTGLPAGALCAYDASQLGDAAAELICLHPFVSRGAVPFRLYAESEPEFDLALTGEIDAASSELFATTLRRAWPRAGGKKLVINAGGLEFISHAPLRMLDQYAREVDSEVVLSTNQRVAARLAALLDLTRVHVQEAQSPRAGVDEAQHLRTELQHRQQQLKSKPAIEQVKGVLINNFGFDAEEAFAVLVRLSQDTDTKLRDVADQLRDELTGASSNGTRRACLEAIGKVQDRLRA